MNQHAIVTRENWLQARKEHLHAEKELTRMRDQLAAPVTFMFIGGRGPGDGNVHVTSQKR